MASYANSNPDELLRRARKGEGLGELLAVYRNYLKVLAKIQLSPRLQRKLDASDIVEARLNCQSLSAFALANSTDNNTNDR